MKTGMRSSDRLIAGMRLHQRMNIWWTGVQLKQQKLFPAQRYIIIYIFNLIYAVHYIPEPESARVSIRYMNTLGYRSESNWGLSGLVHIRYRSCNYINLPGKIFRIIIMIYYGHSSLRSIVGFARGLQVLRTWSAAVWWMRDHFPSGMQGLQHSNEPQQEMWHEMEDEEEQPQQQQHLYPTIIVYYIFISGKTSRQACSV